MEVDEKETGRYIRITFPKFKTTIYSFENIVLLKSCDPVNLKILQNVPDSEQSNYYVKIGKINNLLLFSKYHVNDYLLYDF